MKKLIDFYNLIKDLFSKTKVINRIKLPSQNLFYNDDFFIKIKKANKEDINEYENGFEKKDLSVVIQKVKNIVEKNIVLSKNYSFEDIKSIDIVFLFLEIVKFTRGKKITVSFINNKNKIETIEFNTENFNYFKLNESIMNKYDEKTKTFKMNGYSYSLPSIGVENSLTMFLLFHSETDESYKYVDVDFDFTYFVSNKNFLTFKEIDNLIYIFNNDLEKEEKIKIKNIIREFSPLQKYSLIKEGREIDINSKIDLEKIWK